MMMIDVGIYSLVYNCYIFFRYSHGNSGSTTMTVMLSCTYENSCILWINLRGACKNTYCLI